MSNTGCYKKGFTTLKEYTDLYRGHTINLRCCRLLDFAASKKDWFRCFAWDPPSFYEDMEDLMIRRDCLKIMPSMSHWKQQRSRWEGTMNIASGCLVTVGSTIDVRGAMLQAGRSRARVPMRLLNFFNLPNPLATLGPGNCSASNRNDYQKQKNVSGGKARPARKTDNLTTICEPIV
jgi:hypothetical protein